jgi:hypothetical protein
LSILFGLQITIRYLETIYNNFQMNAADFIAFDVETATAQTNSLCQIGFVMVKNWEQDNQR